LSKAITIITLTCLLTGGVAVTSILARGNMGLPEAETAASVVKSPIANRENKRDRLSVMSLAQASVPSAPERARGVQAATDVLRQAYASSSGADVEAAKAVEALSRVAPQPSSEPHVESIQSAMPPSMTLQSAAPQANTPSPSKPKAAAKPAPQKSYALLSDVQIAGIKERLKLSPSQESYWPGVETALRAVARKIHADKQSNPSAAAAQLDPDCAEVQQLKSAAMPLLFQLREDQKDEVRKLARIIGLEKVAAAI
jgi:ABC-type transporter Mla MlaB component